MPLARSLLALISLLVPAAAAGATTPIPLEHFFRDPAVHDVKLSPSGALLAAFKSLPDSGRAIVVMDVTTGEIRETMEINDTFDRPKDYWWASDERLLFSVYYSGGLRTRLGAVNVDGSAFRDFARRRGPKSDVPKIASQQYGDRIVSLLRGSPRHVLLQYTFFPTFRTTQSKLYRLDVYTGREHVADWVDRRVRGWRVDGEGVARLAWGRSRGEEYFLYREARGEPWIELEPLPGLEGELGVELEWGALAATESPDEVYVRLRPPDGRHAVYRMDVHTGALSAPLLENDMYDVGERLIFSQPAGEGELLGIAWRDHFPRIHWLSETWRERIAAVEQALPGRIPMPVSFSADQSRVVLLVFSERHPPEYYLFDHGARALRRIAGELPDIDPEHMAPTGMLKYAARDGREIHAYVTRPTVATDARPPLIVLPHDGPWARDDASFDPIAQFLASRGWMVLKPNFRGSEGYGAEYEAAGQGEWGLAMQDDITDGVRFVLSQGLADPARVCIVGWSYGGYAALMGLVRTPELYRCGASIAGVTDLIDLIDDREWYANFDATEFARLIGHRRHDRERLTRTSPLHRVDAIRAPVFLAHGDEDRVVRVRQSKRLARALRRAGKPHELFVMKDEPHAYDRIAADDRIELFRRLEAFLRQNLDSAGGTSP